MTALELGGVAATVVMAAFVVACSGADRAASDEASGLEAPPPESATTPQGTLGGPAPKFPGAGTSGADAPIPGARMDCFYAPGTSGVPAATAEYVLETFSGVSSVHVRLTFNPEFVDNTYGTTAVGWSASEPLVPGAPAGPGKPGGKKGKGHTFKDLVGSDHAELGFSDKAGTEILRLKLDYISESAAAAAGFAALGVTGGEGKVLVGAASSVLNAITSLDRNLNERGYGTFIVDSPPTDEKFTTSAAAPNWDFRVQYETWVKQDAFGSVGFGSVRMEFVHASPSKAPTNTLDVVPGDCPADWKGSGGSSNADGEECEGPNDNPEICPPDGSAPNAPLPTPR